MKLRNKKTGEIIDIYKGEITLHHNQGRKTIHFKRLEDLEEWEDYEEPKDKGYWYIDDLCRMRYSSELLDEIEDRPNNWMIRKLCGNYFDTREEAEKAVEKLKAWKRLKEDGFTILGYEDTDRGTTGDLTIYVNIPECNLDDRKQDFDLLFGGEE